MGRGHLHRSNVFPWDDEPPSFTACPNNYQESLDCYPKHDLYTGVPSALMWPPWTRARTQLLWSTPSPPPSTISRSVPLAQTACRADLFFLYAYIRILSFGGRKILIRMYKIVCSKILIRISYKNSYKDRKSGNEILTTEGRMDLPRLNLEIHCYFPYSKSKWTFFEEGF